MTDGIYLFESILIGYCGFRVGVSLCACVAARGIRATSASCVMTRRSTKGCGSSPAPRATSHSRRNTTLKDTCCLSMDSPWTPMWITRLRQMLFGNSRWLGSGMVPSNSDKGNRPGSYSVTLWISMHTEMGDLHFHKLSASCFLRLFCIL